MTVEPRDDVIYRVVCHDCGGILVERDPKNPPDHWPGKWDTGAARSAAKGKRDGHQTDTSMDPGMERHDVEIVEIEREEV